MQVISFMNMKGGVGKTTLAVNIAYGLAAVHDKRVLIIDVDPQFNATQYLVEDKAYLTHINDPAKATIKDIFVPKSDPVRTTVGAPKPATRRKLSLAECSICIYDGERPHGSERRGKGRLDVIPSTLDLVEVQNSKRQTEAKLKLFIRERATSYDYVLIDCPPTISIFTEAAILASDKYIVPIKPDPLSVLGLPLLERYIEDFTADVGMKIKQVGIVFTLVRRPTPNSMSGIMEDIRRQRKGDVFQSYSAVSTNVSESVEHHKPIIYYKKAPAKLVSQFLSIISEFVERTR